MRLMHLTLVLTLALFSACAAAELTQPDVSMEGWAYEPQPMPELADIVARKQLEAPTYGLYLWAGEYVNFHENIKKVGWKTYRIAGPFTDECMKLVARDGTRVMVTLGLHVHSRAEGGKARRRTDYDSDEAFIADYVKGVEGFLKRYGPGGSFFKEHPEVPNRPIMAVEIWNEPNFQYMIPDPKYPGENEAARKVRAEVEARREKLYAKVLPAASKAVKKGWPEVTVVGFGAGGASAGDLRFIQHVHELEPKLQDDYDVLSTHPYARPAPPEGFSVRSWGRYSAAASLDTIRKTMKKAGEIKPVWWTEYGWPISKADGGMFPSKPNDTVKPILQAAYVVRSYLWAMRLGVDRVNTMHVTDTDGFNGGFFADRAEQRWRPSAYAVKTLIEIMPNPKLIGAYADGADGWFAYRYTPAPGERSEVVAVYSVAQPRTVSLPLQAGTYTVTDMLGDSKEVAAGADGLKLEIGACPVYVTKAQP